jgi:hypothetical protein
MPVSRQLGLFVVGRLTAKYGIRVLLAPRADGRSGLRTIMLVPAELVTVAGQAPARSAAQPAEPVPTPLANVVGALESAGIIVRLPEFPSASTPASILFAAHVPPKPEPAGFGWLGQRSSTPPRAATARPVTAQPSMGPDGLPKRVPKGQLLTGQASAPTAAPTSRNAARNRGFLSGFQSGIRSGQRKEGDGRP